MTNPTKTKLATECIYRTSETLKEREVTFTEHTLCVAKC